MTRSLPSLFPKTPTPNSSGISFGRSADGMLVALVGDTAFAMVPARGGRHHLAAGCRLRRPMVEWTRDDFYGHGGELVDEAAFRAKILEQAEHQRERQALARRDEYSRVMTPWGVSQGATVYGEGVESHSTVGHGGFKLSSERNRDVHPLLRAAGGWYEEDACWAIVAITFPLLFTAFERRCAEQTIKDSFPNEWETIFGTILAPGESRTKDKWAFETEHASDWVVVSATTSKHQQGFIECVALLGGRHLPGGEARHFLVPSAEYSVGRFGFVIDPDRHLVYGGPSSVPGRHGRRT